MNAADARREGAATTEHANGHTARREGRGGADRATDDVVRIDARRLVTTRGTEEIEDPTRRIGLAFRDAKINRIRVYPVSRGRI